MENHGFKKKNENIEVEIEQSQNYSENSVMVGFQ